MLKIAALQLSTQALSNARLDYYLRICEQKDVRLVALGEYVLNNFFTELKQMPVDLVKEQSKVKLEALKEYSAKYNLCIVAPIILSTNKGFNKTCLVANKGKIKYINQQVFMPYSHWNEKDFFINSTKAIKLHTFKCDNFKIGVLFGYEIHFDEFFKKANELDLLIIPTANTYNSNSRWCELIKMRAFLNNTNILRVNRIGVSEVDELEWNFYGNSFLCNAYGDIVQELSDAEEVLISEISKPSEAAKFWQFKEVRNEINKRLL
ncbi:MULTISPECIES: carbon-nitrogen hydrolase family protein [unclassified Campylobacter]|uniref:carbon-nitrogen hydrolase family protein n=1 Tax=unclassified Campylobacter TaxID=2593542 RepID=UPI001BDAF369|nr:carbon-nitrogen hydrolase family protein [Campylobacter sp. 2018MI01]MBT0882173.1 carbon-nitrogen hydrolase family protein [Campylobacter sp. 2018MI13]MBZ7978569.1 carbon-nitrogen hydrolase family protein [Campylobacter sp. RM12654]MBZ7983291.1 carbon-nitrogen hydrolase family protein [Campylobacter sp. RM12647]MBZ7990752.1 carbon-nitrogen hydrolase family protein [Campylobacter sp. RM9331]MBZ8005582.1 carbon-nitrogen hydrolase family protein [Campylobacter sp. RM9332]MBZ8006563.1 carbon-n